MVNKPSIGPYFLGVFFFGGGAARIPLIQSISTFLGGFDLGGGYLFVCTTYFYCIYSLFLFSTGDIISLFQRSLHPHLLQFLYLLIGASKKIAGI